MKALAHLAPKAAWMIDMRKALLSSLSRMRERVRGRVSKNLARSRFALACCIAFLIPVAAADEIRSPAEQKIHAAHIAITAKPDNYQAYNDLALAFARRARETSDGDFYRHALDALAKSFELSPGNFEGEKVKAWVLLGQHEFAKALETATALNKRAPDDVLVYAYLTDANVELGNYPQAEEAAQWMLDLRAGSVAGLTRAAYLRELFGDVEGAKELMTSAFYKIPETETEDRAWILTQLGHLELQLWNLGNAEQLLTQALALFPHYHYALATLAKVRIAQTRYPEAVELLREHYRAAPHAENLYLLAEALQLAGETEQAQTAYAEFEKKALVESERNDNANHELVFYYADRADRPQEALRVAAMEIARRRDVQTLHAYAWALYVNKKYAEARQTMDEALAVGIREATFFYHAGSIALKLEDRDAAERYFRACIDLAPESRHAATARKVLEEKS